MHIFGKYVAFNKATNGQTGKKHDNDEYCVIFEGVLFFCAIFDGGVYCVISDRVFSLLCEDVYCAIFDVVFIV